MNISQFLKNFEDAIEELAPNSITEQTNPQSLSVWDSVSILCIQAMLDTEYKIQLSGEELNSCQSVQELFDIVKNKKRIA